MGFVTYQPTADVDTHPQPAWVAMDQPPQHRLMSKRFDPNQQHSNTAWIALPCSPCADTRQPCPQKAPSFRVIHQLIRKKKSSELLGALCSGGNGTRSLKQKESKTHQISPHLMQQRAQPWDIPRRRKPGFHRLSLR